MPTTQILPMSMRRAIPLPALWLLCSAALAGGAPPRIFYSDLESGPNSGGESNAGVFVTIYGSNFGAARGQSKVTTGGGAAAVYPLWTDSKITFQLGAAAKSGPIIVSTERGSSNAVPFTVRAGRILFVAVTGNDANPGTFAAPWKTLVKARDAAKPGDVIYARSGVKQDTDDGQGWSTCMLLRKGGAPGNPIALVAYPGAAVFLGDANGKTSGIRSMEESPGHWVFAGLTLRGPIDAVALYGGTGWRFVANDVSCPSGDGAAGCFEASVVTGVQFLGNNVHDAGRETASSLYHGVYFSTDSNHIEIGWNTIANIRGCRGIQIHSSPLRGGGPGDPTGHSQYDIRIHHNVIHDTQCDGLILATIDPSKGVIEITDNVIYNAGKGPNNPEHAGNWSCINIQSWNNTGQPGSGTVDVRNNTLYNCGSFATPPYRGNSAIAYSGPQGNIDVQLRNNIIVQPSTVPYFAESKPKVGACAGNGRCIWGAHNLFFGSGRPPDGPGMSDSLNIDPLFVDAAHHDFRLRGESPLLKTGTVWGPNWDRN